MSMTLFSRGKVVDECDGNWIGKGRETLISKGDNDLRHAQNLNQLLVYE